MYTVSQKNTKQTNVDPLQQGWAPVPDRLLTGAPGRGTNGAWGMGHQWCVWLLRLTAGVGGQEAAGADHVVGAQLDVQLAAGGVEGRGQRAAAQHGQLGSGGGVPVVHLQRDKPGKNHDGNLTVKC